jgi:hypothetical protein
MTIAVAAAIHHRQSSRLRFHFNRLFKLERSRMEH